MKIEKYTLHNYPKEGCILIKDLKLIGNDNIDYYIDEIATDKKYILWGKDGIEFSNTRNEKRQILFINDNGVGCAYIPNNEQEIKINDKISEYMIKNKIGYIRLGMGVANDKDDYDYCDYYTDFDIDKIGKIISDILK